MRSRWDFEPAAHVLENNNLEKKNNNFNNKYVSQACK
jgi:hypothetical protein